jgi:F-type H+-transporting ATPase subunit delta
MTDVTSAYAQAIVAMANGEQALDTVEDELLTVAKAIDANNDLREKLVDANLPLAVRLGFVESSILSAAHPTTRAALAMVIAADRVSELTAVATAVADQAAEAKQRELAEVYVATPIDDARKEQLRAALELRTGKRLTIKVFVDPTVIGGVRARIGDTVIDDSVARRLADVKTKLGS